MKRTSSSINIDEKHHYSSPLTRSTPRNKEILSMVSYDNNELDIERQLSASSKNSTMFTATFDEKEKKVDTENQTATPALYPILLLNLVAIIWGTQHAIIKQVVSDDLSTSEFTLARFMIGLLLVVRYTPSLPSNLSTVTKIDGEDNLNVDESNIIWRWGIELGIWMFLGYAFQAIGLEYTTAQRSGFLLYLNVKFVPFFAYILFRRNISLPTWLSALTAVFGTYLLANEDSTSLDTINIGDLWSLAAAAASAMFILRLENANKALSNMDSSSLNACCLWTVTIASAIWCILDPTSDTSTASSFLSINPWNVIQSHPFALLYLGGVTTAFANYIQTKAQKDISAERASIIYAMDPVYGAFFSYLILGETMGAQGYFGAFLIACAALSNAILDFGNNRNNTVDMEA